MRQPWFGAKRYGVGIGPRSPAGWIAIAVFVLLATAIPPIVAALHGPPGLSLAILMAVMVGFLALMAAKSDGRPWRWRWGDKD